MVFRLPAGAVYHACTYNGLRSYLTGQIDAEGVVDRSLAIVHGYRREFQEIFWIVKFERGIVVDNPQILRVGARPCDSDRFLAMNGFSFAIDYARIDQPRDSRRDHLGMKPQVVFAVECPKARHLRTR